MASSSRIFRNDAFQKAEEILTVVKLLDEDDEDVFQDAEEDAEEDFEDAPFGKWIPSSALFAGYTDSVNESRVLDESDEEVEDDDVGSLISVSPTPSLPEPPAWKKRDLRSDPFLFKRRRSFGERLRALFCCCGCYKPPDRYYFL